MMRQFRQIFTLCVLVFLCVSKAEFSGPAPAQSSSPTSAPQEASLGQFSAGGQVVGVQPGGIYIASPRHGLHITFAGASAVMPVASSKVEKSDPLPELGQVSWVNLWPGISLTYTAAPNGIFESTYTLAPGADLDKIRLSYNTQTTLAHDGSLILAMADGQMSESAPVGWQEIGGQRKNVDLAFTLLENDANSSLVGFRASGYDPTFPLIIDPLLSWTAFLGTGQSNDVAVAVAVDSAGNTIVCGNSTQSWGNPYFPFTPSSSTSVTKDIFVAKLDTGGKLLWSTFVGGSGEDTCDGLAVDSSLNIYLIGNSYKPVVGWPIVLAWPGSEPAANFVAKLNSNSTLQWVDYLGGNDDPNTYTRGSLAVYGSSVYAAVTSSLTAWGGQIVPNHGQQDVLVTKLNAANGTKAWATFVGGTSADTPNGIAADANGVVVTGMSNSSWGTPRQPFSGSSDALAFRLDTAGLLIWNTFLGGSSMDFGLGVALNANQNAFITGLSRSSWGNPLSAYVAGSNNNHTFLAEVNSTGDLMWNTFAGGAGSDQGDAVRVGSNGAIYISGYSSVGWGGATFITNGGKNAYVAQYNSNGTLAWVNFPDSAPSSTSNSEATGLALDSTNRPVAVGYSNNGWGRPVNAFTGSLMGFVVKLNPAASGARLWNTFLGHVPDDKINGLSVDSSGNIYVIGTTNSYWNVGSEPGLICIPCLTTGFVVKISSAGAPIWKKNFGAGGKTSGTAIKAVGVGYVLVAGAVTNDLGIAPVTKRAFSGGTDSFVASLRPENGSPNWVSYLGGSGNDLPVALDVASSGESLVVGISNYTWYIPTRPFSSGQDVYVAKLSNAGELVWNTFLGGSGADFASGITMDVSSLRVDIAGYTDTNWGSGPKLPYAGGLDGFVCDLSMATGGLQWYTFLGGSGADDSGALAYTASRNLIVGGNSSTTWGATPLHAFGGTSDTYLASLSPTGVMQWNTFLGGVTLNYLHMALDGGDNIFLAGSTSQTWGSPIDSFTGAYDISVAKASPNGAVIWNTFEGGSGSNILSGLAIDPQGYVDVAGSSQGSWGGATIVRSYSNAWDGFVAQLNPNSLLPNPTPIPTPGPTPTPSPTPGPGSNNYSIYLPVAVK